MKNIPKNNEEADPKWQRRKDERPSEILAAALDCFAEKGFAATRLDDIAKRAGVTKGTLYLYFQSKEDIFKSVIRAKVVVNFERLEKIAMDKSKSSTEMLKEILRFWANDFLNSSAGVVPKLVFSEGTNFPEISKFFLKEVVARNFRLIGGIIQRGVDQGEFRAINVENAIRCVIAPVMFAVIWKHSLERHAEKTLDVESLFQTHFDLILRGIQK